MPKRPEWLGRIETLSTTIIVLMIGGMMLWYEAIEREARLTIVIGSAALLYVVGLVVWGRRSDPARIAWWPFALAGLLAGSVAELINAQLLVTRELLAAGLTGGIIGTAHWAALRIWIHLVRRHSESPSAHSLVFVALIWQTLAGNTWAQDVRVMPRILSSRVTGCDSSRTPSRDSVYHADGVDQPVQARRLSIDKLPLRIGYVVRGESTLRFIVESTGRIDRCSIVLLEETTPEWSDAVVRELRSARYVPARRGGRSVRQWVQQLFTYYNDGRPYQSR